MLSTSFKYIYEQKKNRFPTRLDHWLFQDCCLNTVSTDAGYTIHADLGFADNKYCLNVVLFGIFNFCLCAYPSDRHAVGRLSC